MARALAHLDVVTAPGCAAALLLHPTPLTPPALLLGVLPLIGRWVACGRPWPATPFDAGVALIVAGTAIGFLVALAAGDAAVRLTGVAAALILFAWLRRHLESPSAALRSVAGLLILVGAASALLLHFAQPFLDVARVPPLAALAGLLEPLALYRWPVADPAALQRFRFYPSGVGALAAVGGAMSAGLLLTVRSPVGRLAAGGALAWFASLLYLADNRGSILAAALTLGLLVVRWQPRLRWLAALLVFGTLDAIALGLVQRGLSLRTVVERAEFWRNGLLLAAETPLTGVGLGIESVQRVYRAAFQPAQPAFNHAHNVGVQALLEQGLPGLIGIVLLAVALGRVAGRPALPPAAARALKEPVEDAGPAPRSAAAGTDRDDRPVSSVTAAASAVADERRRRAAGFAAWGGAVALLLCGLTEIAALTTLGGALLFALLGALSATLPANGPATSPATGPARASRWPWAARVGGRLGRVGRFAADRRRLVGMAIVLSLALATVIVGGRTVFASPLLNLGTTLLYRATLADDLGRSERATSAAWSTSALRAAVAVDPDSTAGRRNLALVLAAAGDRRAARAEADAARRVADPGDRAALYGVGRAYAAVEAWDPAIDAWLAAEAGPQLLRVGRELAGGERWPAAIRAYAGAAHVGAPGRAGQDGVTRTALAHGETPDQAIARLAALDDGGGDLGYHTRLQVARVLRLAGRPREALAALAAAEALGRDEHWELERALLYAWQEQWEYAEPRLAWVAGRRVEPTVAIPDGDDPPYWLAVARARLGRLAEAVDTARIGLRELPSDQASLRGPYALLLGDLLLALGRPAEALQALEAGRRAAPDDPGIAAGLARARAALGR